MRSTLTIIFLLTLQSNVFGQGNSSVAKGQSLEINPERGVFFYNSKNPHLTSTTISGLSVAWQKIPFPLYNWPRKSEAIAFHARLSYLDYHNRYLGKSVGLQAFLDLPLLYSRSGIMYWNTGLGLAYSTTHFDLETNNLNLAVGARVSYKINFGVGYKKYWTDRWYTRAELGFMHVSNGGYSYPNEGLNSAQLSLGAGYVFARKEGEVPAAIEQPTNGARWAVQTGIGFRQAAPIGSRRFALAYAGVLREQLFTPHLRLSLGVDYFHDWATRHEISTGRIEGNKQSGRLGLVAQQEWLFGRLGLQLAMAAHVVKHTSDPVLYQKAGVRFQVNDRWRASTNLIVQGFDRSFAVIWGGGYVF